MATFQQVPIVMPVDYSRPQKKEIKNRKALRGLAVAEVAIGSLCVVFGITIILTSTTFTPSYHGPTTGEGIYLGVMVVISGGLGIGASDSSCNRCLLYGHLAFSMFAAFCAAALFATCIPFTILAYSSAATGMYIVLTILSFASLVLLIISASVGCCSTPGCCQVDSETAQHSLYSQPYTAMEGRPQVVYIAATPQAEATTRGNVPIDYAASHGGQNTPSNGHSSPASPQQPAVLEQLPAIPADAIESSGPHAEQAESSLEPYDHEEDHNPQDAGSLHQSGGEEEAPPDDPPAYSSTERL